MKNKELTEVKAAMPSLDGLPQPVVDYVLGLVAENARMREAIEFATAPDMWQEQHDGMLDYRYVDWYVDVLNAALEPKSTDAAIAEIKLPLAAEVDAYRAFVDNLGVTHSLTAPETNHLLAYYKAQGVDEYAAITIAIGEEENDPDIIYAGNQAKLFAANLRAGRKG